MKILKLDYLIEDISTSVVSRTKNAAKSLGLNFADTKKAVSSNLNYNNNITKEAAVNKFRKIHFVFADMQTQTNENEIYYPFVYILNATNDEIALFPYTEQGVTLVDEHYIGFDKNGIPSYFSLKIGDPSSPQNDLSGIGDYTHVNSYFDGFTPIDTSLNTSTIKNTFLFNLQIGPNFNEINKKYNIKNNLLNLPNYDSPNYVNQDYVIKFLSISDEFIIKPEYDENQSKRKYQMSIKGALVVNNSGVTNTYDQLKIDRFNKFLFQTANDVFSVVVTKRKFPNSNCNFITKITKSNVTIILGTINNFFDYTIPNVIGQVQKGELYDMSTTPPRPIDIDFVIQSFRPINSTK